MLRDLFVDHHDWWISAAIIGLTSISIIMLLSTSLGADDSHYVTNQLMFIAVGLAAYLALSAVPPTYLVRFGIYPYIITTIALVILAVIGQATRGAVSWFDLGSYALQPSEFAKVSLVLALAFVFWFSRQRQWPNWRYLPISALVAGLPISLILLQPDFGTAAVMIFGWLAIIWLTVANKKLLFITALIGLAVAVTGWFFLAPYQQQRVATFVNPAADPLGSGYNVLQSVIAVQSGGLTGQGWGQGTQSHLNFLPEHHTDFMFASFSEEFGFIRSLVLVALYAIILWRGLYLAWRSTDQTHTIILGGIIWMLLAQTTINIAMNIGLAPVTGIPLPMVSYGGSSMLASLVALGLIQSISRQQSRQRSHR